MMESSNSGSFQSSSGGEGGGAAAADNGHEYDSTNLTQSQTQSISSAAAANNNFFINNNNNNNNPTTTNFNHLLQPPYNTTFYSHHPPPTSLSSSIQDPSWTQTIPIPTTFNHQNPTTTKTKTHQIGVTKKRTRASRRAPTTVLTTDTTNFRQMVQEFTGIPTAPFTRRLDLFRPKIQSQHPSFLNNNIVAESSTSNNMIHNNTTTASNYQFSSPSNFPKQPSAFLDLQQNPIFSFQSLLQNSLPKRSWGEDQNGKLETQTIGGSKLNSALEINAFSAGADQVQGNEGSWICPSN